MGAAVISFSSIAVGVRELGGKLPTIELLFARSLIGVMIMSFVLIFVTKENPFLSQKKKIHFWRNLFHFGGQYGWFVGILHLPLAEVFALEFTVPVWASILAYFILKEQLGWQQGLGITLGMIGVLCVVRPGIEIIQPASLVVLGAAVCFAMTHVLTRSLAGEESTTLVVFYMCLIQLPIGGLLSASVWQWPDPIQAVWLIWIGLSALAAHFSMTRALHYSSVQTVLTLDFIRLPFIALVGVVLYSELLDYWIIVGGGLMLVGNLFGLKKKPN